MNNDNDIAMNNKPRSLVARSLNPVEIVIEIITAIRCKAINIEMILVRKPTRIKAPKIISMTPRRNIKLLSERGRKLIRDSGTNDDQSCGLMNLSIPKNKKTIESPNLNRIEE